MLGFSCMPLSTVAADMDLGFPHTLLNHSYMLAADDTAVIIFTTDIVLHCWKDN